MAIAFNKTRGGNMSSWRERLCGSVVMLPANKHIDEEISLEAFKRPNQNVSCGGGFFKTNKNLANVSTAKFSNVVLPTTKYSVLIVKGDGSAVIYSDTEVQENSEDSDIDLLMEDQNF